jgi:hypothetical protein
VAPCRLRQEGPKQQGRGPAGYRCSRSRTASDARFGGRGGLGAWYSRYFQRLEALSTHQKTKAHKKRIKELQGAKPHVQADAEAAAGMGKVDNGPKLRSSGAVPEQMALEGMAF